MMFMVRRTSVLSILLGVPLFGCGAGGYDGEEGEPLGSAVLEISTVPSGAQCLQVIGTGASAFGVTTALTAGSSSASVSLGRLPLGSSTINANVYDVACGSISGVLASWVADPQTTTFRAGVISNLTLTLRPNNPVAVNANFVGNVVSMVAGYDMTGLVMSDATTRTTGNWYPLGGGQTFANSNPSAFAGVTVLAAPKTSNSNSHGCATRGTQVVCWGDNTAGEAGAGIPIGSSSSTPVVVSGISGAREIVVGQDHTCAFDSGGDLYCWGSATLGQNGGTTSTSTPTFVSTTAGPELLTAGINHTCVNTYGGVRCWGSNSNGQLGDGTTTNRSASTTAPGLEGTVSLAAGHSHTCAVRADGTARCWGSNSAGQLGDGTTTQRLTATQVSGITDAVEVAVGWYHTCLRRSNGTVSCFGDGAYGQTGDGTAQDRLTPLQVPGLSGVTAIVAGTNHTCALLENRTIQCWGSNYAGQCGDGTESNNYKPVPAIVQ